MRIKNERYTKLGNKENVPTSPQSLTRRLTSEIEHRCLVMEGGYEVDPRRIYQGIRLVFGRWYPKPMLEIDIGPHNGGRRSGIGLLNVVKCHERWA